MATAPITVTVTGQTTPQFTGMFDKAKDYIKNFRNTINTNLLNTVGAATMAGKAIGYVTQTMREVTSEAKKFEQQSSRLGVAPEQIAKLNKLSEESGVPFRAITKGLNQVKQSASQALLDPNSEIASTFKKLGIDATALGEASKDPMAVFGEISDRINEIGDDAEQLKALEAVFKQNGFMLKGIVEMGAEGQKKLVEGNTTMGALSIAQNAEMKDAWEKFWDVIKNGFAMFGIVLNPIVQSLRILLNLIQALLSTAILVGKAVGALIASTIFVFLGALGVAIGLITMGVGKLIKALGYLTFSSTLKEFGDDTMAFGKDLSVTSEKAMSDALLATGQKAKKVLDAYGESINTDLKDADSAVDGMTKGYDPEKEKAEGERRFQNEKEIAEARKKYNDELKKGALLGQTDLDKRKQIEEEIEEIREEGRKNSKDAEKQSAEHFERMARFQAKANELRALQYQQDQADRQAREKREADALRHEEESKSAEIAREQALARERFSITKAFEDYAEQVRLQKMKASGATETEMKLSQLDKESTQLEKMKLDVQKFIGASGGSLEEAFKIDPEGTTKVIQEFTGQLNKVRGLGAGLTGIQITANADDARKRGMGGSVSTMVSGSAIPKAQLDKLTLIEENTKALTTRLLAIFGQQSSLDTVRGAGYTAIAKLESDRKP